MCLVRPSIGTDVCVCARSFCRCFDEDFQTQILARLLRFVTRFGLSISRLFASTFPNVGGARLTFVFVCCVCRARVYSDFADVSTSTFFRLKY
jgi:hypothetical protein